MYKVSGFKRFDLYGASVVDWVDTLAHAKRLARFYSQYKSGQTKNKSCKSPVGEGLQCNCNECLQNRGIWHIEISKFKKDKQTGSVDLATEKDICHYDLMSDYKWEWTDWD